MRRADAGEGAAPTPAPQGTLFVVATPIGNLGDLSFRALETLRACRLLACEDTRVTRAILARHAIEVPLVSCHRYNERATARRIVETLVAGGDVALVSDGGTPGVSDPGAVVVREVRGRGLRVVPVPGPSAATALVSVSGVPPGPFLFVGFLPHRAGERRRLLASLAALPWPLLFYESPHRVRASLADAAAVLGERRCLVGREMTKVHEEFLEGTLSEVAAALAARPPRGEYAVLVGAPASARAAGAAPPVAGPEPEGVDPLRAAALRVRALVEGGMERAQALRQVTREAGLRRRDLYAALVRERSGGEG